MPAAVGAPRYENVACRLGDVRIGRVHLATPPWVPGFPGQTSKGGKAKLGAGRAIF